jgi:tripartite-type tricarboxylate transporter receptor subunit TctC
MTRPMTKWVLALACVLGVVQAAGAQDYPTKPVKLVVENVSGARGTAATEQAAGAAPDRDTLLAADAERMVINPTLYPGMKVDPSQAFAPVARVVATPLLGVVPARSPAKDIKEFLGLAQLVPASYNYGSAGIGAVNHLGVELLKGKTGTTFVHTPRWRVLRAPQ